MSSTVQNAVRIILWVILAIASVAAVVFALTVRKAVKDLEANLQHVQLFGLPREQMESMELYRKSRDASSARFWCQRVWLRGQAAMKLNHLARQCDLRYPKPSVTA